ncbi:SDR family oxidoreductase [Candidatus Uhrbacteria bacterium]|nr:SDR family oxidoreductase [Candidatus Uhrbacteria bacterium]
MNFLKRHSLKGKIAWITGGKRIGQEIAVALAEIGADLVISYRSSEKEAREIEERAKQFGRKVLVVQADMGHRESVAEAVEQIRKEFGKLDILILLASVFKPVKLEDISEKDWDSNVAAHLKGTFWPIQLSLPLMQPGSHIVAVSDRTAIGRVYPGYLPYVVTKSAVAAMIRGLAVELGPRGIFVNAVAPGPILKPDDISDKEWAQIRAGSMIGYPITDEEAVLEFIDTVIRLCFVRSSGATYPLELGHS